MEFSSATDRAPSAPSPLHFAAKVIVKASSNDGDRAQLANLCPAWGKRSGDNVRGELKFQTRSEEASKAQARFSKVFKLPMSKDPSYTNRGDHDSDTDQKRAYNLDHQLAPEHKVGDHFLDTNVDR
jgi:hypothetical protein